MIRLIIGIGNPGKEYEDTYHNVGALALAYLVRTIGAEDGTAPLRFKTHKNLFRYASARGIAFVLPLTFMNESGAAAKEALRTFGAKPAEIAVLHDESDLAVGAYKISAGQNSAGHKGVQSIMDAVRSKEFTRARIGIRPAKETARKKASEFVLSKIMPKDARAFEKVFEEIARTLLGDGNERSRAGLE